MVKHFPPISIEKFAAYLDGNLPQSEIQQISQLTANDPTMQELIDASTAIDVTQESYADTDLQLPNDIQNMSFNLPDISSGTHPLVNCSPKPTEFDSIFSAADMSDEFLNPPIENCSEFETSTDESTNLRLPITDAAIMNDSDVASEI